jgi:hypothetical protein
MAATSLPLPDPLVAKRRIAIIALTELAARNAVKRKLRAEGRVKLSQVSPAQLAPLVRAYLLAHRAELLAQAEASPIVQNLRVAHRRRTTDPTTKSVCESQVQNLRDGGPR